MSDLILVWGAELMINKASFDAKLDTCWKWDGDGISSASRQKLQMGLVHGCSIDAWKDRAVETKPPYQNLNLGGLVYAYGLGS